MISRMHHLKQVFQVWQEWRRTQSESRKLVSFKEHAARGNLQRQHMHKEFPIDAYASPPADKDSNKSLFEKGNGTFGNGNTFDVISGIRRSRPNSPPEPMASNETLPNRRVSPTGLETKVENRNGAKHSGMDAIYPTQLHQDDHAKLAYLSRLQMEVQNARKEVHAAKNAIQM